MRHHVACVVSRTKTMNLKSLIHLAYPFVLKSLLCLPAVSHRTNCLNSLPFELRSLTLFSVPPTSFYLFRLTLNRLSKSYRHLLNLYDVQLIESFKNKPILWLVCSAAQYKYDRSNDTRYSSIHLFRMGGASSHFQEPYKGRGEGGVHP